ncbi:MAG: trypsin-like peptidase domain-containing protein [Caulobacterales bacterium]|nr:trypsin-like peptidase domain-containing protein [Caulobacterales bacterium]
MRTGLVAAALAAALAMAGPCAAQHLEVVVPASVTPEPPPAGMAVKPISLARIAANMAPGTLWADETVIASVFSRPCTSETSLVSERLTERWKESDNHIDEIGTWDRVLRQEFKTAGFAVADDPTNLFEAQQGGELQLGALITDIRVHSCLASTLKGETFGGSVAMNVEWQVYSVTQAKVVAKVVTHGGVVLNQSKDVTMLALITGAFGDNARRLLADPEFRRLVLASPGAARPTAAAFAPMRLKPAIAADRVPIAAAVKSVVTVYAGNGSGSGVLISPEGYILTNHHVAGSSGEVRVRWADGTSSVGQVVRADPRRDVALIRAKPAAAALPIRHSPAVLGESVFAVGTPLRDEFANTLTRGVISGTRMLGGLPMIQSDVAVDHGNSGGPLLDERGQVMALTVAVYAPDDVSHNINFFIPIASALQALGLTVGPEAAPDAGPAKGKVAARRRR